MIDTFFNTVLQGFYPDSSVCQVVNGAVVAEGKIRRFRESNDALYWEYELDKMPHTWFAKNLLSQTKLQKFPILPNSE